MKSNINYSTKTLFQPNRGFQEFRDKDRAFIVRFLQDNTFETLDYKSQSIVGMDLVERLGVAKSDQLNIRCRKGTFTGKVWFVETNADVKRKAREASELMERFESGEDINLSNISLGTDLQLETDNFPSPLSQPQAVQSFSDNEFDDDLEPALKRNCLDTSVTTPQATAVDNSKVVCD